MSRVSRVVLISAAALGVLSIGSAAMADVDSEATGVAKVSTTGSSGTDYWPFHKDEV